MSFRRVVFSRFTPALFVLSLAILLGLGTTAAWSQATSTATVTGLVTDEQNAAVAGAEVRLLENATGASQTTLTNETGRYVIVNVQPGTYIVTISKQGFTVFKINAQKVDVGTAMTINATLKVGSTSTTVEVTASVGADLQTTNATVGNTLTSAALMLLPNMGRDVSTLAVLQPGVSPTGMTAGAFSDQNVFMLDGGNNSDDMAGNNTSYVTNFTGTGGTQTNGSPSGIVPTPVESIEEFKVGTLQSVRRLLRLHRLAGSDGDQARHQRVSRFRVRLLLRHQRRRRQQLDQQSHPVRRSHLYRAALQSPRPLWRLAGRRAASPNFWAARPTST